MARIFLAILLAISLPFEVASGEELNVDMLGVSYETEQWHVKLHGVKVDVGTQDGAIEANDVFIAVNKRILTGYRSFVRQWQAAPHGRVDIILIRDGRVVHSHLNKWTRQQMVNAGWEEKFIRRHQYAYFSRLDLWNNRNTEGPLVNVLDVLPLSRAAQAGIRPSDRIRKLDGDRVEFMTAEQVQKRLATASTIQVERSDALGKSNYIDLDVLTPNRFEELVDLGRIEQYTIVNTTPFNIQISLIRKRADNTTSPPAGPAVISPGTKLTFMQTKDEGSVFGSTVGVSAETVLADDPVLQYLYGDQRWYQWPTGDGPDVLTVAKNKETPQPYAAMQKTGYKGLHHQFIVALPPGDNPLTVDPTSGELEDVANAMIEAAALSKSLRLQMAAMEMDRQGKVFFETGLGIDTTKDNPVEPGVLVENTWNVLISGESNPIHPGDILLSYGGEPVHGYWDVLARTIIHGSDVNRGINAPVPFTVYRPSNEKVISGTTSYFFNEAKIRSLVPEKAFSDEAVGTYAGFDSLLLSFGDEVSGVLGAIRHNKPVGKSMWEAAQFEAMRRQINPDAFMVGELVTIPFSLPRAALKRVGPRFLRPAIGSTPGIIATDALAAALLNVGDPLGRTREQMFKSLKTTMLIVGGASTIITPAVNHIQRMVKR